MELPQLRSVNTFRCLWNLCLQPVSVLLCSLPWAIRAYTACHGKHYGKCLVECFTCYGRISPVLNFTTARHSKEVDWCGVDLHHTWMDSEKVLLLIIDNTNLLLGNTLTILTSLLAFTYSATHQIANYGFEPLLPYKSFHQPSCWPWYLTSRASTLLDMHNTPYWQRPFYVYEDCIGFTSTSETAFCQHYHLQGFESW